MILKHKSGTEHKQGYLFLTPALVILFIFVGVSVLFVLYLSFQKVNLYTGEYTFVGLQNYLRVFTDDIARKGLMNTLLFSVVVVPVQTVMALVIASILNSGIRGKYFFRTVYFLPALTSSSALTMIFMFMFSVTGPINTVLIKMNLVSQGINFLQEPDFALKVIMLMNIWSTVPYLKPITTYVLLTSILKRSLFVYNL